MHFSFRIQFFFAVLFFLSVLTGCNKYFVSTAYNNLDRIAIYRIDDYFDINAEQRKYLKKEFVAFLDWHRAHELEFYRDFLSRARQTSEKETVLPQEIKGYHKEFLDLRDRYVDKLAPAIIHFLPTVTPEQIDYLEEELADYNSEEDEKLELSEEKFYEKALEKRIDSTENYIGTLRKDQIKIIENQGVISREYSRRRSEQRKISQQKFLDLMKSGIDEEAVQNDIIPWMKRPQNFQSTEYVEMISTRLDKEIDLIIRLHDSLDKKQKKFLSERFDLFNSYIDRIES